MHPQAPGARVAATPGTAGVTPSDLQSILANIAARAVAGNILGRKYSRAGRNDIILLSGREMYLLAGRRGVSCLGDFDAVLLSVQGTPAPAAGRTDAATLAAALAVRESSPSPLSLPLRSLLSRKFSAPLPSVTRHRQNHKSHRSSRRSPVTS